MDWYNFSLNIFISLFAATIFWVLTFKISLTNATFSSKLEKSKSSLGASYHRYRIRIANFGYRDLIEVSIIAQLTIAKGNFSHIMPLAVGNQGFLPIMYHHSILSITHKNCIHTLTLYPSETTRGELSKKFYTQRIRRLAKRGEISLDDIFDEYKEAVSIQVYLYGNDKTTGARRLFTSPVYCVTEICEGKFPGSHNSRCFMSSQKKLMHCEPSKSNPKNK